MPFFIKDFLLPVIVKGLAMAIVAFSHFYKILLVPKVTKYIFYPNCSYNCPPPLAKTRKKKIQKSKKSKKNFFLWFWGPHKFVENRQIYRKDFKIYKGSTICYEI